MSVGMRHMTMFASLAGLALNHASPVRGETAQDVQDAATEQDSQEIVVVGRLRTVEFDAAGRRGRVHRCRIVTSTGDRILDRLVCQAARRCTYEDVSTNSEAERSDLFMAAIRTCVSNQTDRITAERRSLRNRRTRR